GRLLVEGDQHPTGSTVEPVRVTVITDVAHDISRQAGDVDVTVGRDLPRHDDETRGQQRLARHPAVGIRCQYRIEHRVRDLIGHLVGMSFGHRLRCEGVACRHESLLELSSPPEAPARRMPPPGRCPPRRTITLSKMAWATSSFEVRGTSRQVPSDPRIVTALVSWSKPTCCAETSLATM